MRTSSNPHIMSKLSVLDLDLKGKRVFIRVDFNVPLKDGRIGDDTRIRASLPTITHAMEHGATVVLASHLGRPKGQQNQQMSLRPVADRLADLLNQPVSFAGDCVGDQAKEAIAQARRSGNGIVLLENLRFHAEEEKNDPNFSKELASLADEYVNDAFGAAHRAHASVEGITHHVKRAAAGLLMEQELRYLGHTLESPERPFVAILGGAKVYDKIDAARAIEADAKARGFSFKLPIDHVVTDRIAEGTANELLRVESPKIGERMGVDIGPATISAYTAAIADAKTVVWNGPMGVFEIEAFATGTNAIARAVAAVTGTTIIGGGDSIAAVKKAGIADRITHISTGGGASLEFLAGNWTMFKTVHEAVVFVKEMKSLVKDINDVEIVVAPPFTAVHAVAEALRNSNIGIAAQDLYWEREGAFTGEVAPGMIKEAGGEYAIVGHSERRRLFGETDAIVNRKAAAAIGSGLTPIVCIGETLEERERDETLAVLDRQIKEGLDSLSADQIAELVVAYEPVWAIGTGRNATAAQAGEAHAHIRKRLRQWFGGDAADRCHVIYGGSVKPDNISELIAEPDVDGALVGGASLDVRSFTELVTGSRPRAV